MPSFLTNIQVAIHNAILGMRISGGYNSDWLSINQEDMAKITSFPHANVYLVPEETSLNTRSFPNMNSYRNVARFQIHGYNRLSGESANSQFDIDAVLNDMLDDLKRMLHLNYTLGGIVEGLFYVRSTRVKSGKSDDVFIPEYLVFDIEVVYNQDADQTTVNGCV